MSHRTALEIEAFFIWRAVLNRIHLNKKFHLITVNLNILFLHIQVPDAVRLQNSEKVNSVILCLRCCKIPITKNVSFVSTVKDNMAHQKTNHTMNGTALSILHKRRIRIYCFTFVDYPTINRNGENKVSNGESQRSRSMI